MKYPLIFLLLATTCLSAQERCCIKTTSDQYGYSIDLQLDPATGETKDFSERPEHAITLQKLAIIDLQKKQILLEDGSLWSIPEAFFYNVTDWKANDTVQLYHPQTYDGDTFNLINKTHGNGIKATLAMDERYLSTKCYFRRFVESSNKSKIYVSDQTAWEYDPLVSFQPMFAAVPPGAPILYAVNTGSDAFQKPVLLISFSQLTPDRIAVKATDP